jgi:uncharacterized protein (TIGR02145 family)
MEVRVAEAHDIEFAKFKECLFHEARILARFDHPHIATMLRVFEAHGTAYLVTAFVEGQTLQKLVQESGPLSERHALEVFEQLLAGVEHVHREGVLHGDLKPANIILSSTGVLVLVDFGAARELKADRSMLPWHMFTPGFAPPEQHDTDPVATHRWEVYALGAIFYHLITGKAPTAPNRSGAKAPTYAELKAVLRPQTAEAIRCALENRPEHRFQSVADLRYALFPRPQQQSDRPFVQVRPVSRQRPNFFRRHFWVLWALGLCVAALSLLRRSSTEKFPFGKVCDSQGACYRTADIGGVVWMVDDLKTTKFTGSQRMRTDLSDDEWSKSGDAACTAFGTGTDEQQHHAGGVVYNYFSIVQAESLCPEGWRVPRVEDWVHFRQSLDEALLRDSTQCFSALESEFFTTSGVYRNHMGNLHEHQQSRSWWTASLDPRNPSKRALAIQADTGMHRLTPIALGKRTGLALRCIHEGVPSE